MDAPDNLATKTAVALVFIVPVASLVLHLALKPRFWTPSLIVLGASVLALTTGEYVHSKSLLIAVRNGFVFGALFSFFSVLIGLVVRLLFRREYAEEELRQIHGSRWRRRNRILAGTAMVFGISVLTLAWAVLKDFEWKGTILAAVCFYMAYKYWRYPVGAPSVRQWIVEGEPSNVGHELSNNTAESDARKSSVRRSP